MISLGLAVVVAGATVYIGYRYYTIGEIRFGGKSDQNTLEPEVVKQKTERWSEEAAVNPAFQPGKGPDETQYQRNQPTQPQPLSDDGRPVSVDTSGNTSQETGGAVDTSEMQFHWRADIGVTFDDIGGMDDLKHQLRTEVIKPLEDPEKAEELGVAAPNVIFYGPPGTGKTFTTEALATEFGLPFAKLSGAEVQSKWVTDGPLWG